MTIEIQKPFDDHGRSPATQRFEAGRRLMDAGSFEEAAEYFCQAAIESPHFKTYELLGECYMRLNRSTQAIPYFAAATTLNRGVRGPTLLAEAWLKLNRHTEALEAAEIALSRDPKCKAAFRVKMSAVTGKQSMGES